ncbi:uncharacterized protein [Phyllobates terribilis]|uniref:uncharacterized protein n=1 Tax=Phyllobates terribilis TaxID=111132 RepID=UPI003CCA92C0
MKSKNVFMRSLQREGLWPGRGPPTPWDLHSENALHELSASPFCIFTDRPGETGILAPLRRKRFSMHLILYFVILTFLTSHGKTNMAARMSTSKILLSANAQCDRAGFCPKIECGISEIKVKLLVSELQAMKVDVDNIHLIDNRCRGFQNINGILYISMTRDEAACGTVITKSETHATYKNTIFLPPDPTAIIFREFVNINVVCTYPLEQIES